MGSLTRRSNPCKGDRVTELGPLCNRTNRVVAFILPSRNRMAIPSTIENERLLELFFSQSLDGFFFMMLDEPVDWDDGVDKDQVLDYVFDHQRMTKLNSAILDQFNAASREELLGMTPAQFFAH